MRPFANVDPHQLPIITGCDEVGRGPLAGPVVVAAVWFDPKHIPKFLLSRLDDSKRLSDAQRHTLAPLIHQYARVLVCARSAFTIDQTGIRHATLAAMAQASQGLSSFGPVAFDGIDVPNGAPSGSFAQIKGDQSIPQIAAASIVAKQVRDHIMTTLGQRYPMYRWSNNAGYGTKGHLEALALYGPTRHHRFSFAPVRKA